MVDGLRTARKLTQTSPLNEWIKREVTPGPAVQTDEEISEFARLMLTTLFRPIGSIKMGDVQRDPTAVVDAEYKVRHLTGLRIVDAGVVPLMTTISLVLTVLTVVEHAAEIISLQRQDIIQPPLLTHL